MAVCMPCATRPCFILHSSSAMRRVSSARCCTRRCSSRVAISHSEEASAPADVTRARTTSTHSAALLEARGLHFAYAAGLPEVVCAATLALRRGTLAALIGANGSGKSSLIRLLACLFTPARGEVLFDGVPLRAIEARVRARRIAYVPQATATV